MIKRDGDDNKISLAYFIIGKNTIYYYFSNTQITILVNEHRFLTC